MLEERGLVGVWIGFGADRAIIPRFRECAAEAEVKVLDRIVEEEAVISVSESRWRSGVSWSGWSLNMSSSMVNGYVCGARRGVAEMEVKVVTQDSGRFLTRTTNFRST